MEKLLHYAWLHRRFLPLLPKTTRGEDIEIIDPGLWNHNAGPDFFNAKIKVGGTMWVGNVEIHILSSDWTRHRHHEDAAYDNVILHVVQKADAEAYTLSGRQLMQMEMEPEPLLRENYAALLAEAAYPPCYRIIPDVPKIMAHAWMTALTAERLEAKTERIKKYLQRTQGDWERTFFIALARNFGFNVNSEAFEQWAFSIEPSQVGKHRDNLQQVEAYFMGQAGLLTDEAVAPTDRDDYFIRLQKEYRFLQNKFSLVPMQENMWRYMRLRPHNFPTVRLSQLANLYHKGHLNFSLLLEAQSLGDFHALLSAQATPYWCTHFRFGRESKTQQKQLRQNSLDLLCINTAAPLLFAYGQLHNKSEICDRAFNLLETIKSEQNYITRTWKSVGLEAEHAADSQALIHLKTRYCDRKDCLRCRFGNLYLKPKHQSNQPAND